MLNFFTYFIFWSLIILGLIDFIKWTINIHKFNRIETNGIYVIVAAKNQELQIEGFLRSAIFKLLYGKGSYIKNVMVTDLNSVDGTKSIIEKMSKDYSEINIIEWKDCKKILDEPEQKMKTF